MSNKKKKQRIFIYHIKCNLISHHLIFIASFHKMNIYEKYLKNNEYIDIIKKRSEIIIKKYFSSGTFVLQPDNDNKDMNNFYVKKEKDELDYLLSHIYRIENEYFKQNLLFELLDKDGIVIDKNVYSKKFKRSMNICGHHMYLKNAAYANEVDSINKILMICNSN